MAGDMEVQSISQRSEGSLAHSHFGNSEREGDYCGSEQDGRAEETNDQLSPLPSFYNGSPLRTPLRMQQQSQSQQPHRHGEDY
jgi:hypothetical protein